MSLDIWLVRPIRPPCPHCGRFDEGMERFDANITHNLVPMWREAGCADALYENDGKTAGGILPALEAAVVAMRSDPARFMKHDSPNGWGLYEHALPWLEKLTNACRLHPDFIVRVSR